MSSEEITVVARTLESVMGEEISPQEAGLGKSATGLS
jgi:hypothetical protein